MCVCVYIYYIYTFICITQEIDAIVGVYGLGFFGGWFKTCPWQSEQKKTLTAKAVSVKTAGCTGGRYSNLRERKKHQHQPQHREKEDLDKRGGVRASKVVLERSK